MQQQTIVDAIQLSPSHVCTFIVPSSSTTSTNIDWSKGYDDVITAIPTHRRNSSDNPMERSQTPDSIREEQLFGSFDSINSTTTSINGRPSSPTNNNNNNNNNVTTNISNQNHPFRHISSSSTVASSTSNSSTHQQYKIKSVPSSSSSLASAKQQGSSSTNLGPSMSFNTSSTSSSTLLNLRPGSLGSLSSSANPHTTSPMKIIFQKYLLVPTMDGRVHIYQIMDYYYAQQRLLEKEIKCHDSISTSTNAETYHSRIENIRAKSVKLQQEKEAVEPLYTLGPFYIGDYEPHLGSKEKGKSSSSKKEEQIPATIVAIDNFRLQSERDDTMSIQYVSLLTNEGDVHIIKFYHTKVPQRRQLKRRLQIEHIQSFYSGNLGAICIKVIKSRNEKVENTTVDIEKNNDDDQIKNYTNDKKMLQVVIGHSNGVITCFEIVHTKTTFESYLKWIGHFDENCSILSLSSIGDEMDEKEDHIHSDDKMQTLFHHQYLIVAMGQNSNDSFDLLINTSRKGKQASSTSNMSQYLEIVNISLFEEQWKHKFHDQTNPRDFNTLVHSLSLGDFTVWPLHEMLNDNDNCVFVNASKTKMSRHKKECKVQNQYIHAVNIVDQIHNKNDHAFVASMSDGTMATMHYFQNKCQSPMDQELLWEMSTRKNKIKLPHQVCSAVLVDAGDRCGNVIVACLRDSSVFIIPVSSKDNLDGIMENIALYKLPLDTKYIPTSFIHKDENNSPYTEGFTAAMINVDDWDESGIDSAHHDPNHKDNKRKMLFVFHAWACGWIDCHCIRLQPPLKGVLSSSPEICNTGNQMRTTLTSNLAARGILSKIVSFLFPLKDDSIVKDSLIFKAAEECRSSGETVEAALRTITSECGDDNITFKMPSLAKLIDYMILNNDKEVDEMLVKAQR